MKRRDFLKTLSAGGLLLGSGLSWNMRQAQAEIERSLLPASFPVNSRKILLHITLDGGPDFRHLLPPAFSSNQDTFAYNYWKYRADSHSLAGVEAAWQERWQRDYFNLSHGDTEFGILNGAGWLKEMWDGGNLAIVNNALGSNTRDHSHSLLVLEQGDRETGPFDFDKSGWGGRLAAALGEDVKVISLTHEVRRFCFGPHASNPKSHSTKQILSMRNSRDLGLFDGSAYGDTSTPAIMSRSLRAYYQAKREEISSTSPYAPLMQHEKDLREFGEAVRERLIGADAENPNIPVPDAIRALYDTNFAESKGLISLNNQGFGQQIRNLYDAFACGDLINFQVASMGYGGWDTHKNQKRYIEQRFEDLFHSNGGLATLYKVLPSDVTDNLIITIAGEFGRQLKANGDLGTDHGRGNSILVLGKGIQGGVYGDMFPATELERIEKRSPDIKGLTGIERIFGAACDYVKPGVSAEVFPTLADAPLEEGLSETLFS